MPAESSHQGLSENQASILRAQFGRNALREPKSRGIGQIARETLREPMFLLLAGAAALYLVIGDLAEGLFLSAGAMLSLGLVIAQQARSERALRALNAIAEPRASVIRSGTLRTIAAADLVPGDIILVAEGGRLPADAILIEGDALEVDESALTGEAVPRTKSVADGSRSEKFESIPGQDLSSALFAATLVVRGQGVARVTRTGARTEVGKIGSDLGNITEMPTLLQRDIGRLIGRLGVLALLFCVLVALAYGLFRDDWFQGVLAGLTLAISLIPEEFPMVLTIFMALGAWRLAKRNVLVRRSAVIETLGATTLLCVDKTGTLTENRLTLRYIWRGGCTHDLSAGQSQEAAKVVGAAGLASALHPHDPIDMAVHKAAERLPPGIPLRSYPLRPDFLAFTQVWSTDEGDGVVYAAKGAPETIFGLCHLQKQEFEEAEEALRTLAAQGLRVLGVATAACGADPKADPANLNYQFEGLLGLEDPVRIDVPPALRKARQAGVDVIMITGDFPTTALAAAKIAGIDTSGGVQTGAELADGNSALDVRIFARIMPNQKLILVERFKTAGHTVAMTGDGINDAPALAAADIGIAMGLRGTDVAREAADLILLDDRFATIVDGIALGRRIFANLRRAMIYITAIHIPVAGLALFPILIGLPPMLYPMHLVLLELMIDPICSLVFEGESSEAELMDKPPRPPKEPLFGRRQLALAALQGTVLLVASLGLYGWIFTAGVSEDSARSAAFLALVTSHLTLAIVGAASSSELMFSRQRVILWTIIAMSVLVLALAMSVSPLVEVLRFGPLSAELLMMSLVLGLTAGGWWGIARRFVTDGSSNVSRLVQV